MAQAFRTQNLRLLGNLFDKNNSLGAKGYSLYSTGDGTAWKADQNEESGILSGGVLSIGTGSTISVSAGTGQIYGNTLVSSEIVTTVTNVSWSAFTNVSLNYLATKQFTYLYIDNFGALVQSNTVFSDSVFKNYIVIGIVIHLNNTTIDAVINAQNVAYGDAHRLYELYNSFGPMKRSGLSLSASGATLKINRADGTVLLIGCNYTVDQFEPDISTLTSYLDVKFARVRANGSGGFTFDSNSGSLYTVVDPNNYDNGTGTLASVTAGYWTIQRFYLFPNVDDRLVNYYGIATYATLADALLALPNENFSESPFTARDAVFLGYLIVKQGVTDLSNSGNAKFLQAGLSRSLSAPSSAGGGGGSAATALDDLTDVQIGSLSGGQFLTYDSSVSLWKNRSFILDANNNELIKFPSTVASAVNELTISNAAATGSPSISATGDDTNIGLNLISKGTGLVQINGKAISLANSFTTSGNFALTFTTTATTSLTLPTSGTLATTSQIPTVNNNTLTLAGDGGISLSGTPTFTANASADKTITISIADGALAISKLANIATLRILGRTSGSSGPVQELDGSGVVTVIGLNAVTRTENIEGGNPGQIPYQSAANTTLFSAAGTANQVLLSGGTGAPTWANQSSLSVGSATTAGSLANALTISSPLTGTSYNGSSAVSIGLQNATASLSGGVSTSAQTFGGDKTFADNVIVSGNLTVNGTTVTVNTTTLAVKDKNIELGLVTTPTDVTADGGGITLKGTTDKTIIWVDATDAWTLSEHLNIASGKVYRINGTDVLSSTTLGSGIVNSSLTSVGTLTNLTVTNTINGSVSGSAASLSGTYTFWGQSFNGTQNVSGNLTSVGNITGTSGITITAGGSNQNVVLTPSGTGYTLLNGSVGIGNSTPNNKLTIQAGDDKDSGPIINLGGNDVNQFESGRIRFTEKVTGTAPFYQGAYLHYDGSNNLFHIGVHDDANSLIAGDTNAISIIRSSGNVGIGTTTSPNSKLYVSAGTLAINQRAMFINADITTNTSVYTHTLNLIDGATDANPTSLALGTYSHVVFRNRAATAGSVAGILDIYTRGASTDPTVKMTVTDVGNVGVGHTSPNNKLAISGSTSIGSSYNIAAPANGLIVEGNVGIGISNPTNKLHVVGSHVNNNGVIRFESSDYSIISLKAPATGDGSFGYWGLRAQDSSNNDLMFYGYRYTSAFSGFWIDPDFGSNIAKGFFVKRSDGNVGIGINTPSARLHVNSATSGATLIRADGTNGTLFSVVDDLSDSLMSVNNSAGLPVLEVFADDRIVAGQYGQNDFVVINNKVGVGTANPINKLSIIGAANIGDSTYNVAAPTNGLIVQGDVGIGTVSPTAQSNYRFLQVNGTNSAVIEAMVGGVRIGGFDSTSSILYVGTIGAFPIVFRTGVNEKWRITNAGVLQSSGAQTIQTDTGNLTIATAAGDGHIILSPHGTGKVGIGTATPAYKLDVVGGNISTDSEIYALGGRLSLYRSVGPSYIDWSNGQNLIFRTETSVGGAGASEKMRIQSDGNVGIGTTTPSSKLHISNAAAATRITITDDITNGRSGYIESNYSDALVIGTTSGVRSIKFAPDNSIAMTIQVATNNVGIGTVTPGYKLDVNGTARIANDTLTTGNLTIAKSGANLYINGINSDAEVHWQANGTSRWAMGMNVGDATENLNIYNYTTATTNFTILKVDGNVGIGIAAPTNKLDVNGTVRIRSISASGSQAIKFLTTDANGVLISRTNAEVRSDIGAGTGNGSVTSVNGTGTVSGITLSGTVTTTGDLTLGGTLSVTPSNFASQTANTFLAAPNGAAGAPTFRVMATADIPNSIITFAKLQDVAGPTLIGRISATAGPVAALSSANARTAIGATTVGSNLITLADPGAIRFIRINADNTVSALSDVDFRTAIGAGTGSGTVTSVTGTAPIASSGGTTPAISLNDAGVTYAKIQNVTAGSVLGRVSGVGSVQELDGSNIASIISTNYVQNANNATNATNSTNVNITTDDATNSSYYLYFGANASGNTGLKASTKIRYNPNTGAFSATTKSFRIPHPTKPQHDLVYGSLESPYHGIRLTGKGKTKGNRAEIILPDYVKVLIDKETVNIQLSVIKCAKILYIDDIIIDDNKFTVKYDKSWYEKSKDVEFYWDFTAERKDVPKLIVEEKL